MSTHPAAPATQNLSVSPVSVAAGYLMNWNLSQQMIVPVMQVIVVGLAHGYSSTLV
jgi:hypothetical protein